jgi:TPR repeat protein
MRLLLVAALAMAARCSGVARVLSLRQLAQAVRTACDGLGVPADAWLEPGLAAAAAAAAIARLRSDETDPDPDASLPPQGEFRHAAATTVERLRAATSERFAAVKDAAHNRDPLAMHTLGLLHYSGVGGASRDETKSAYWHAAAAAEGNIEALATLGGCVRRGVGAAQDKSIGIVIIEACAAAGSAVGLVKLGVMHEEGAVPGLPPDFNAAANLFERAAAVRLADGGATDGGVTGGGGGSDEPGRARRSALGLFHHGFACMYGIGVARDVEAAAAAWLAAARLAPDDGSEEAAWGLFLEQGNFSTTLRKRINPDRALRLAAALEHAPAVAELARRDRRSGRATEEAPREEGTGERTERFTREGVGKARAWTERDERAEAYLDQLLGG